ncbi:MAG: EAL domain-containing protein [Thainema sp.]
MTSDLPDQPSNLSFKVSKLNPNHQSISHRPIHQLIEQVNRAVSEAIDSEAAFEVVLQLICQLINGALAEIWLPTPQQGGLCISPIWYSPQPEQFQAFRKVSEQFSVTLGTGLPGRVAVTRQPEWIAAIEAESDQSLLRKNAALQANLNACLGVPIKVGDRVLAVLIVWLVDANSVDPSQIEQVRQILTQLGAVLRLKQSEAVLAEQQQRLKALMDSLPGIVFVSNDDAEWSMQFLSQGCYPLTGYSPSELAGPVRSQSYNDITHPEDLPRVLQAIDGAIAQQQPYVVEYRIRTKQGEEKWLWEKGYGVTNAQGKVIGLEGFITDITERKQTERTLQEKEAFLKLILDNIPQHIFWKDRNLTYQGGNQVWLNSIGLTSLEDVIGKTDYDLWSLAQADNFRDADLDVLERHKRRIHVIRRKIQQNGDEIWQDVSKVPIYDADNNTIGILGMFEDITEWRKAEEAIARREQYLAALVDLQYRLLNLEWDVSADLYAEILPILGQAAQASRAGVFEVAVTKLDQILPQSDKPITGSTARPKITCWQQSMWADPDFVLEPEQWQLQLELYHHQLSHWFEQLLAGEELVCLATAQLETELQAVLAPLSIQGVLMLPLKQGKDIFGFIVLENCTYELYWEDSEIDLLKAAAAAISLAYEHQQTKSSLKQAEVKYRSIFENAVEGIFQTTPTGQYLTANPMLAQIYGYDSPEELIQSITNIQSQLYVDPQRRLEFEQLMAAQGSVFNFESQIFRKDGSIIWISESARTLYDETGAIAGYEGTVENITPRKHDEAELLKRDHLLEGVAAAATCLLTQPDFATAIPSVLSILGEAAQADRVYIYENHPHSQTGEMAMSMRFEWTHADIVPSINQPHWQNQPYREFGLDRWYQNFQKGQPVRGLTCEFPASEQQILLRDQIQSILMVPIFIDQVLWGYIGFDACQEAREWTASEESILVAIAASLGGAIKRQQTEAQMRHQAFHDSLTGLPNRTLFNEHLPLEIAHARRSGEMLGVMFLDLDRFKNINDTLGHAVGDELLRQATQRLQQSLREADLIARWGGDEFTLVLPHLSSPDDAAKIARRIRDSLATAFHVGEHELYITSSMGLAIYPQDGEDLNTLLQNADTALYRAKDEGRNNYQFYRATLNSQASRLLQLENHLHHALPLNELELYYQPQVNIQTGQVIKMEALLRWHHSHWGSISPGTFIPLAEESGLIVPIGEWAIKTACAQNRAWQLAGIPPLKVAVNLSARQFQQPSLLERITQILQTVELAPEFLELEITETAAMQNLEHTSNVLEQIRAMGISISMDDFGTGYSSLSYLKRFPLHTIKIDQSFIRDLIHRPADKAIVSAIITLSRGLGLSVVAEGVETQAHMECLRSLKCKEMQGYWFSRPLTAEQATQFLLEHQQDGKLCV